MRITIETQERTNMNINLKCFTENELYSFLLIGRKKIEEDLNFGFNKIHGQSHPCKVQWW